VGSWTDTTCATMNRKRLRSGFGELYPYLWVAASQLDWLTRMLRPRDTCPLNRVKRGESK
jgi:hypothetical protein